VKKHRFLIISGTLVLAGLCGAWGFFAHPKINRLAVFTLPPPMIVFYKKHIQYLAEASVNPDRRRYAVPGEAPRHFIDLDAYGDSAAWKLPRYWNQALDAVKEDTLQAHGILPWHVYRMYLQLRDAFLVRDPSRILKLSAELGHYVADAHVPLHTTRNYNGQFTGQDGIHAFWESRLPELFAAEYDFFVGSATYEPQVQHRIWNVIAHTNSLVDSVLRLEKELSERYPHSRFSFETRGKQTAKVYSIAYAREYHRLLRGMVERQMRGSIKTTADLWYSAWLDGGQPDLNALLTYSPTEEEIRQREEELKQWKQRSQAVREHENENP
jgi:hypothetical protein